MLRRVIARLAENGKAVFFSSPVLEQVDRLCTHLAVLKKGAVVVSAGSMEEMHAGFGGLGAGAGLHAVDGAGGCGRDCAEYCFRGGRVGRSGDGRGGRSAGWSGHFSTKMVRGGQDDASSESGTRRGRAARASWRRRARSRRCLLLDKYSAFLNWMRGHLRDDLYVTSIPDKYLFLTVAMAVAGIVTVLKWDQILPDAQDYLNFAPLPVRSRQILLANAVAILTAVLVVAVAVNAIPAVLFPMFVTAAARVDLHRRSSGSRRRTPLCVILASVFSIASTFAILGAISAALPRRDISRVVAVAARHSPARAARAPGERIRGRGDGDAAASASGFGAAVAAVDVVPRALPATAAPCDACPGAHGGMGADRDSERRS